MSKIFPQPYLIKGKIQNYDWGTRNEKAFLPQFLGFEAESDVPYAEYWIGINPKAPSELILEGKFVDLSELIKDNPSEILGKRISERFNNSLPFLLKVLSIEKALSIQAHPDKELAAHLHQQDPDNYPDTNHKPEIAIAIDNLKAIVGIKDSEEFWNTVEKYPEIKLLSDLLQKKDLTEELFSKSFIKQIYSEIMFSSSHKLNDCIDLLNRRFENDQSSGEIEKEFLRQYKNYGADVGLISLLLFNHVNIDSGEAIFTLAGVPHAYLSGNIVECMANSDNVVRAGLTSKFKDVDNLVKMLEIGSYESNILLSYEDDCVRYKTPAEEFEICSFNSGRIIEFTNNEDLIIILILKGSLEIEWGSDKRERYITGQSILIPAVLKDFIIRTADDSLVYSASVP